jgi:hypothetical protein
MLSVFRPKIVPLEVHKTRNMKMLGDPCITGETNQASQRKVFMKARDVQLLSLFVKL